MPGSWYVWVARHRRCDASIVKPCDGEMENVRHIFPKDRRNSQISTNAQLLNFATVLKT